MAAKKAPAKKAAAKKPARPNPSKLLPVTVRATLETELVPIPPPGPYARLDELGVQWVCDRVADMKSMTAIANEAQTNIGSLMSWVQADPLRLVRVKEARRSTAQVWDDLAVETIRQAGDGFELSKAKELAHHYRWRASKIAPKEYGERLDVDATVKHDVTGQLAEFIAGRTNRVPIKED